MATKIFDDAWQGLSEIQRQAAEWNEGPLLVLAGPGSGKTRVLTCRIARLLDISKNKNFHILGLTFTNKAADEMRTRVSNFVLEQENRLFLGTFHSFCAEILRQHGTHIGIKPDFKIYSQDYDLQSVLDEAVKEAKKTSHFVVSDLDKKTLPVIHRLKSLLIFPDQCREAFSDVDFRERIAVVYPAYEAELAKRNTLDFNSLILKTYQLFTKFPNLVKHYQTVYKYICVDEFQDTNKAQYALIRIFVSDEYKNLFVVADDDQIIFQWNGASHKRIEELVKDYSPSVIQLPMNYRCPQEIVEVANRLIQHNFFRTPNKKPLSAFHLIQETYPINLLPPFEDYESEAGSVAQDIKQKHSLDPGKVVVLARNRKLLEGVKNSLTNIGLSAVISQRKDEFESTPFVWLHSVLRLAGDQQSRNSLEAVCGTFNQLARLEVDPEEVIVQSQVSNFGFLQSWVKIVRQKNNNKTVDEMISSLSRCLVESRDFLQFSNIALSWFDQLMLIQRQGDNDASVEVFAGYDEEKLVWEELLREIKHALGSGLTLEAFLQELQMRSKESSIKSDTVVLMTIHGSKGKEFEHVYLIGLVEDELPSFQSKKKGDSSLEMEEERRNCFVAITRTIKSLTLSYAKTYRGWQKQPSRFLFEMGLLTK